RGATESRIDLVPRRAFSEIAFHHQSANAGKVRPVHEQIKVGTTLYAVMLCLVIWFKAWGRDYRYYWRRFPAGVTTFILTGLLLVVFWSWSLLSTPAPATGDPRMRGGYTPQEQRELAK